MPTALACLCLLGAAFALPVPPSLPGTAAGNCVGQHRILLKGCNAKHGFFVFKYIYFSTRKNQTHIKKEEAGTQDILPSHRLGVDGARQGPTEKAAAPGHDDDGSTEVMEKGIGLGPQDHSPAQGLGGVPHSPRPGTVPRAHGGVGTTGPSPGSSEGSGDQNSVVEDDGAGTTLPRGRGPARAVVGSGSSAGGEDRARGATRERPGEGATTAAEERPYPAAGAGDEGSGQATAPGRGQEAAGQGTAAGGARLPSVAEKVEAVQVEGEGQEEYTYSPGPGGVTIPRGKAGTAAFTHFPPARAEDGDEVNIFIGKANIRVGEQETTRPGATLGSKEDGSGGPLPGLGVSAAPEGEREDGSPGTAATPRRGHGPGRGHSTAGTEDAAAAAGEEEEPAAPRPWSVPGGEVTVPVGSAKRGDGDDEAEGEGQGVKGRLGGLAVTVPQQRGDDGTAATVPAKGASIQLSTTAATPQAREEERTTSPGTAGATGGATAPAMPRSTVGGSRGSGEVRLATPEPRREGWPGAGLKGQAQGVGLGTTPRAGKEPSRAQVRAGGSGGSAEGSATKEGGSSLPRAGQAEGSATKAGGSSFPRAGQAEGSATKAGGSSPPRTGQAEGSATKAGGSSPPRTGQAEGSATKAGGSSIPRAGQAEGSATKAGGGSPPRAGQAEGSATKAGGSSPPRAGQAEGSATKAGGSSLPRAGQAEGSATKAGGSSPPRTGQAEGSATKAGGSSLPRAGQEEGSATKVGGSSPPRRGQAEGSATKVGGSSLPRAGQAEGSATKAGGSSIPRAGQAEGSATKAGGSSLPRAGQAEGSATKAGGSSLPRAGQAEGSAAAVGTGQDRGQGGEARGAAAEAGGGRYGRRQGAGAAGTFSALSRGRQLEHLRRAAELHVRERAFYSLGTEEAGPHAAHLSLASSDSSRSSEGDAGSRSDSQQAGLQPSAWGGPEHPYGRWMQGTL